MSDPDSRQAGQHERLRRWRLVLGSEADNLAPGLSGADKRMDAALQALYGAGDGDRLSQGTGKRGGLGASAPGVARWLGDIRTYFPSSVVRIMQQDAIERLNLTQLLLEPEILSAVEPDIHLVATLIALNQVMPNETRATARLVVQKVAQEVMRRLATPMRQAVRGSLNRAMRNRRPRHHEIDWHRTIRQNLKHYQPAYRTVIPATRIGYGHRRSALRDVILCIDQSGSMAFSVVYSGILGAVLASIPSLRTTLVVFDTSVVDLTELLQDPVDVLFGAQLGGGTDINRALAYCEGLITRPRETVFILISDLFDGGDRAETIRRAGQMVMNGVQFIALLALSDDGAPIFDHDMAAQLAEFEIPAFACTPDQFPDLMAAALSRQSIQAWAASRQIVTAR